MITPATHNDPARLMQAACPIRGCIWRWPATTPADRRICPVHPGDGPGGHITQPYADAAAWLGITAAEAMAARRTGHLAPQRRRVAKNQNPHGFPQRGPQTGAPGDESRSAQADPAMTAAVKKKPRGPDVSRDMVTVCSDGRNPDHPRAPDRAV
jgi:hypothetical protein